jgi:hypothetical protein
MVKGNPCHKGGHSGKSGISHEDQFSIEFNPHRAGKGLKSEINLPRQLLRVFAPFPAWGTVFLSLFLSPLV